MTDFYNPLLLLPAFSFTAISTGSVTTTENKFHGDIGFANLPNQIHREVTLKGFDLTLMVVGRSGLGKSTFVNTLFSSDIYEHQDYPPPGQRIPSTTSVRESIVTLVENDVHLTLKLVDTPGFGNAINNSRCWVPIEQYIDEAFAKYESEESRINRTTMRDGRVHCCIYFLAPCIHGVRALDIEAMERLHTRVNVIPVIAKADTLTNEELELMKERVRDSLAEKGIKIFEFPQDDEEEDVNETQLTNNKYSWPFAITSSAVVVQAKPQITRGRQYAWGRVEVENPQHSDFVLLRDLIIRTYMQELIDTTNDLHYENFRAERLASLSLDTSASEALPEGQESSGEQKNFMERLDEQLMQHEKKLEKMEREMTRLFEERVREKQQKIRSQEELLLKEHEEMQESLKEQKRRLEEMREAFQNEKQNFEAQEEQRRATLSTRKKKFF
eukprot:gene7357-505_t